MALFQSEAVTPHTLAREREGLMRELRFNRTRFIDFLGTMARHYRQPLDRQISIFFHAPQSGTAYADVPLWWRLGRCLIPHPGEWNRGVPVLARTARWTFSTTSRRRCPSTARFAPTP